MPVSLSLTLEVRGWGQEAFDPCGERSRVGTEVPAGKGETEAHIAVSLAGIGQGDRPKGLRINGRIGKGGASNDPKAVGVTLQEGGRGGIPRIGRRCCLFAGGNVKHELGDVADEVSGGG